LKNIEKALYLAQFSVPAEALEYVFEHSASYYEPLVASLGRFHLVFTTVKQASQLPTHAAHRLHYRVRAGRSCTHYQCRKPSTDLQFNDSFWCGHKNSSAAQYKLARPDGSIRLSFTEQPKNGRGVVQLVQ
jgi:NADH:ubiquinone oxidoreductase subunit